MGFLTGSQEAAAMGAPIGLPGLPDDGECFELARRHRWQDAIAVCPACGGDAVRNGRDDAQPRRRRTLCKVCRARCDDLTGTVPGATTSRFGCGYHACISWA